MKTLTHYLLMAAAVAGLTVSSAVAGAPVPEPTPPPNTITSTYKPGPPWSVNGSITITAVSGSIIVWHHESGSSVVTVVVTAPNGEITILTYTHDAPPSLDYTVSAQKIPALPPVPGLNTSW